LQRVTFRAIEFIIIDFIQVGFQDISIRSNLMDIVFVGRVAGPVSAGGVNFDNYQMAAGKTGGNHAVDLPGGMIAAPDFNADIGWSD